MSLEVTEVVRIELDNVKRVTSHLRVDGPSSARQSVNKSSSLRTIARGIS